MLRFNYSAKSLNGELVKGEVLALNFNEFNEKLKRDNLYVLDYKVTDNETEQKVAFRLKGKLLVVFTSQLATLLSSGIPLVQAFDILYDKSEHKKFKKILLEIYQGLQQGKYLSACMESQIGVFPALLIKMIKAGEVSGTLEDILQKMSFHYEKETKLNNKVRSALMYPIILSVISVAVVAFLVTFVLPTFMEMFQGQALPLPTRIVMGTANFVTEYWYIVLLLIAAAYMAFTVALKTDRFRFKFDRFKLKLPVFGVLNRTIYSARFARTFSSLHSAGLPVLENMETSSQVLNNTYLSTHLEIASQHISQGDLIATSIEREDIFDRMLTSMIFIGEQSGALDDILEKTANFYEEEADAATTKMVSLIEPIMLVVMGIVIGFIVISIMLPIMGMYDTIA
ncbi:MAG: type II secretion system F family protein [Erysipelotrichaceae bacterium]